MSLKDAEKEIQRLNKNKAFQNHDNSVWFNKENTDIFTEYFCTSISNLIINKPIKSSIFFLKLPDVTPLHKKVKKY